VRESHSTSAVQIQILIRRARWIRSSILAASLVYFMVDIISSLRAMETELAGVESAGKDQAGTAGPHQL
jgi:hypothetical protein